MAHASGNRTDNGIGKAEKLSRYAAGIHQVSHQDKEGGGDHGEGIGGLGNTLQHYNGLHPGHKNIEERRKLPNRITPSKTAIFFLLFALFTNSIKNRPLRIDHKIMTFFYMLN